MSRRDLREGQLSNVTRYTQLTMSDGRAGHPEVKAVDSVSGSPHMPLPAPQTTRFSYRLTFFPKSQIMNETLREDKRERKEVEESEEVDEVEEVR